MRQLMSTMDMDFPTSSNYNLITYTYKKKVTSFSGMFVWYNNALQKQ